MLIFYQSNIDGTVVSGSSQIDVNQTQNFQTFSSSVDSRLDNIEGTYSESVDSRLDNIESYTSSLKNAIDVSGQNLIVFGDLTVQGTTTTLNTTELVIEDKVLSLASGSTTSAQADGAGLHISGADVSILWKDSETLFNANPKLSSSVGFKGNGSELTGVTAASVDFYNVTNRPVGLVSGSTSDERISTLTSSLDYRYLMVFGDNVFSGSSQVDLTQTTNYVSGIKDRLNAETVVSGSSQINFLGISSIPTNIVSSSTDSSTVDFSITNGVITAELIGGVISGSSQVVSSLPTGTISGSGQVVNSLPIGTVSGSSQVIGILDSLNSYSSSLKTAFELTGSNVVVLGDLSVRGTTTTINSTTIQLDDNIISLNAAGTSNSK